MPLEQVIERGSLRERAEDGLDGRLQPPVVKWRGAPMLAPIASVRAIGRGPCLPGILVADDVPPSTPDLH